jgi:hypothetical protein
MNSHGICPGCGKADQWLMPIHGDHGGPQRCFVCAGAWNAQYTRRRKWGRIIIKAMNVYLKEGGRWSDLDKFKMHTGGSLSAMFGVAAAGGMGLGYESADTVGTEVPDITSELLDDILQLVHPDRHAPEQQKLAKRTTQELLALRPFVFPAPKPPEIDPTSTLRSSAKEPLEPPQKTAAYPCEICAETVPYFYCDACKSEWGKRRKAERDCANEKQRKQYARRRKRKQALRPAIMCAGCGRKVESNRKDAKFCGPACRQKAHRKRVTAVQSPAGGILESRNGHDGAAVTAKPKSPAATLKIRNEAEAATALQELFDAFRQGEGAS